MRRPRPTPSEIRTTLRQYFGFADLRDGQRRVVESILDGRDTVVVLPTGGGKSLCYQLPALALGGLTIVVSPLIALMDDQVQALCRRGIRAAALHSALPATDEARIWSDVESRQPMLLYLSPERLLADRTLNRLCRGPITQLAIDEAHCISEWGYDFRPAYLRLSHARQRLMPGVTVALTATATPATRADIVARLELNRPLVVVNGFDRPNLHFAVEPVRDTRERLRRISALLGETAPAPCIVYAGTRASVDAIARYLRRTWPHVDAYHAGRSAEDRSAVQRRFLDGTLRVLVATNAFGMGVDKPNVRLVAHAAPPGSIEAYYQEAGRASRDGDRGRCVLLASGGDRALHDRFLASTYPPDVTIRRCWVDLNRHAGRDGCVTLPPAPLSGLTRDVEDPALALLARLGLVELRATLPADSNLRLLCTPATAALAAREVSPSAAQLLRALATSARPWQEQRVGDIANPVPQGAVDELLAKRLVFLVPPPRQVRLLSREREPPIDWRSLHARIGGERARIDAMHAYTTTTRCRRWYLLRYFGQHHSQQACGDCDNCARAGPGSHG